VIEAMSGRPSALLDPDSDSDSDSGHTAAEPGAEPTAAAQRGGAGDGG
jgi:hypothetical protein